MHSNQNQKKMNEELKKLFEKSGFSKYEFAKSIGIFDQNLNRILSGQSELKISKFNEYKENHIEYLKRKEA